MAPDINVTSPPNDRRNVRSHLRVSDQLYGLFGSLGPSQVTLHRVSLPICDGIKCLSLLGRDLSHFLGPKTVVSLYPYRILTKELGQWSQHLPFYLTCLRVDSS